MIVVVFGPEWQRIRAQLLKEEKHLDEHLARAQRRVVEMKVDQAQAWVRTGPVRGGPAGHTGLRRRVADAVKTVHKGVGSGAWSRVFVQMKEHDERNLPLGLDREQGWAHPFFGDKKIWYREKALKPGWFSRTFSTIEDDLEDALFDELQASVRRIDNSS